MISTLVSLFYLPLTNISAIANYILAISFLFLILFTVFYFIVLIYSANLTIKKKRNFHNSSQLKRIFNWILSLKCTQIASTKYELLFIR